MTSGLILACLLIAAIGTGIVCLIIRALRRSRAKNESWRRPDPDLEILDIASFQAKLERQIGKTAADRRKASKMLPEDGGKPPS
ncbi:hypothetical protein ACLIMP_10980 [Novosphingobium aerophilum]|uniref:hypothetical protein n=1 Tax=Novosphingobium aerophilum TaxID=2839843 RepID=UPI003FD69546